MSMGAGVHVTYLRIDRTGRQAATGWTGSEPTHFAIPIFLELL